MEILQTTEFILKNFPKIFRDFLQKFYGKILCIFWRKFENLIENFLGNYEKKIKIIAWNVEKVEDCNYFRIILEKNCSPREGGRLLERKSSIFCSLNIENLTFPKNINQGYKKFVLLPQLWDFFPSNKFQITHFLSCKCIITFFDLIVLTFKYFKEILNIWNNFVKILQKTEFILKNFRKIMSDFLEKFCRKILRILWRKFEKLVENFLRNNLKNSK